MNNDDSEDLGKGVVVNNYLMTQQASEDSDMHELKMAMQRMCEALRAATTTVDDLLKAVVQATNVIQTFNEAVLEESEKEETTVIMESTNNGRTDWI